MTLTGTIKVWNGTAWVATVGSGGGGDPPPPDSYADTVLADSPTSFWDMQDTGSTAVDSAGSADITLVGVTPTTGGPAGNRCFDFDGSHKMDAPSDDPYQTTFWTVEAWVKTTDSTWSALVSHQSGSGYNMFVHDTSGVVRCSIFTNAGNTDRNSTTAVDDGVWHHCVMTDDGVNTRIYVDGVLEDTTSEGGTMDYSVPGTLMLGAQNAGGGPGFFLTGLMAYVAIYDHALDDAAVLAHFEAMGV